MNLTTLDIIVSIIYFVTAFGYAINLFRKNQNQKLLKIIYLSLGFLLPYCLFLEIINHSVWFLIPTIFFALFYWQFHKRPARLINGWLFMLFWLVFAGYLTLIGITTKSLIPFGVLGLFLIIFILLVAFGIYGLIIFLLWNSYVVFKKESRSLANMLTFICAIGLILYLFLQIFRDHLPHWFLSFLALPTVITGYFMFVLFNFLVCVWIYQFLRPKLNQDYLIVLGAGLINGERVTPLLAQRINRAIEFFHLQKAKTNHQAKFIMSGGQGPDEKISEAQAMKNYALEQGMNEEDILLENQSTTTLENMHFSKQLMDNRRIKPYHVVFFSNNYHIFRAGIFAEQVGLTAQGLGAHTARYFLPNALLREFAAIVMMNKRRHMIICGIISGFYLLIWLMDLYIHFHQ